MIIIGAKGFAKEVLEVLLQLNYTQNIAFYDDVNQIGDALYDKFPILKNENEVKVKIAYKDKNTVTYIYNKRKFKIL
jgi:hypothetical protein